MSLKSFDNFCAKIVNNDPLEQKDIFDERQTLVRSQITIRALQFFAIAAGLNLIIMECGPQWCESYVLSTAIFGAAANLYWVIANLRKGSLFGISGAMNAVSQAAMFFGDGILAAFIFLRLDDEDMLANFFFREGMVSEYLAALICGILLISAGAVMSSAAYRFQKLKKADHDKI